jgi:hypothetical protein
MSALQLSGETTTAFNASKKQWFEELKQELRDNLRTYIAGGLATGTTLAKIHDHELYKLDGFETWEAYSRGPLREEFGIERAHAYRLMNFAKILPMLPPPFSPAGDNSSAWSQKAVLAYTRLVPQNENEIGQPRDFARLNKPRLIFVANKVNEHCKQNNVKPTASVVNKFVDEEKEIDRVAKTKETKQQHEREDREREEGPNLSFHIWSNQRQTEKWRKELESLPGDGLELFNAESPEEIENWVKELESLLAFLRKVQAKKMAKPLARRSSPR